MAHPAAGRASTRSPTSTPDGQGPRGPLRRTRACYLAIGVTVDGEREVLGIWWQETEGAKFWLAVLNDLHHRGVAGRPGVLRRRPDGFPEAIEAVFPQAWVQTCIVHQIRDGMRFVTYQDRSKVAADSQARLPRVNADAAAAALRPSMRNGARSTR